MTLTGIGALSVAEIVYYSPALVLAVLVCARHGFGRDLGWFYLVLVSVLRVVGAASTLYMETQHDYSKGLVEIAAITSAVGTAPLLLVLLGLVERVQASLQALRQQQQKFGDQQVSFPQIFRAIHLVSLVGLILSIVGGVKESESEYGTPAANTGLRCREAGSVLFLVVYLAAALLAIWTKVKDGAEVPRSESRLVTASLWVLPFLLVRLVYSIGVSFAGPGSVFFFEDINVWIEAFMMFLMEIFATIFYLWAGLLTPRSVQGAREGKVEILNDERPADPRYSAA